MSALDRRRLLELLEGDSAFLEECLRAGVVRVTRREDEVWAAEDVGRVLVARTLVRDLEVNWAGVEIILRMRGELLETRRQVEGLLRMLADLHERDRGDGTPGPAEGH